jgi:hypothetical protein
VGIAELVAFAAPLADVGGRSLPRAVADATRRHRPSIRTGPSLSASSRALFARSLAAVPVGAGIIDAKPIPLFAHELEPVRRIRHHGVDGVVGQLAQDVEAVAAVDGD